MGWGRGLLRDRNVDQGGTGSVDYKPDGTTDDTREAGLGKERKLGLKRVGDTHLKPQVLGWARELLRDRSVD